MYKYALLAQAMSTQKWKKSYASNRRRAGGHCPSRMQSVEKGRKYEPVLQHSRARVEEMLRSGVPDQISEALWSAAYYDPDWRWVQTQCLLALEHSDVWVRRNASTCLGLLAVFHKKLDAQVAVRALKKAAEDPEVKPWAEDSLADIEHCMGAI